MPPVYWAQVRVLLPVLRCALMHLQIVGEENVPRCGPVILAANHPDNWDPYISNLAIPHRTIHHFARADGMATHGLGAYWRQVGALPANGEGLHQAIRILRVGGIVGVYPEGRITQALTFAGSGAAILALRSGAPISPVAVWGTQDVHFYAPHRRPRVTIRFGAPRLANRCDAADLSVNIMRDIAAMLPECYRGIYAEGVPEPVAVF
jgi:1-acyl-sn-glycerol-3-phosphate acyltransferase